MKNNKVDDVLEQFSPGEIFDIVFSTLFPPLEEEEKKKRKKRKARVKKDSPKPKISEEETDTERRGLRRRIMKVIP